MKDDEKSDKPNDDYNLVVGGDFNRHGLR